MAKGLYLDLLLIFDADPKVTGHHRAIGANNKFPQFKLFLMSIQHAWVYKAQVGDAPEFFAVIFHRFLDLHTQGCARVVIEP